MSTEMIVYYNRFNDVYSYYLIIKVIFDNLLESSADEKEEDLDDEKEDG